MSELRVHLTGNQAHFGRIAAADVAKLLIGTERALAHAAAAVLGRPKTTVGRYEAVVAQAARVRLKAIEGGSFVPVLELPEPQEAPGELLLGAESLSESATTRLLNSIEAEYPDRYVVEAVVDLSDQVGIGVRYDCLLLDFRQKGRDRRAVRLDTGRVQRLRDWIAHEKIELRQNRIIGTLVEADFERMTARLRGPMNAAVSVSFDDELADGIQDALRRPAAFEGRVAYDPETLAARSVDLSHISVGRQLVIGVDADDFWLERSFQEFAREQGAGAPIEPDDLYNVEASEADRAAFMTALAELD